MKRITLVAAAVATLGLAAPAVAGVQLARSLGVEPGALTANELARLRTAVEENDDQRIRLITNSGEVPTQGLGSSAHQTQIALLLGVEPDALTADELVRLRTAVQENDDHRIRLITNPDQVSTRDLGRSAHQTQLARSLGVEPGALAADELVRLHTAARSDHE